MSKACSGGLSCLWKKFYGEHPPFETSCKSHDLDYRQGRRRRSEADRLLRVRVADKGYPVLAWVMWLSVRIFGGNFYNGK